MNMYRVVLAIESDKAREFLASMDDAWCLWYRLTQMAAEEPRRREQAVVELRESRLSLSEPSPEIVVRVFDLEGHEVCPERGLRGMSEFK